MIYDMAYLRIDINLVTLATLSPWSDSESFSLTATIDLFDFWLKCFDKNDLEHSNMYIETMKDLF